MRVRLIRDVTYTLPVDEYRTNWQSGRGDLHGTIKKGTIVTVAHEDGDELAVGYKSHIVFIDRADVECAPSLPLKPLTPDDEIPF